MGILRTSSRVKLITGLITGMHGIEERIRADLERSYGPVDLQSPPMEFNFTRYYQPEMGDGLRRFFFSFTRLIDPGDLASIKLATNSLEDLYRQEQWPVARPVNLDPGYLELGKLVLASTKNHCHRIYLRDGIFAEVTLCYRDRAFHPLEWTFPDYRTEEYHRFFLEARHAYHRQLREAGSREQE
jgi:hypothetical protein